MKISSLLRLGYLLHFNTTYTISQILTNAKDFPQKTREIFLRFPEEPTGPETLTGMRILW